MNTATISKHASIDHSKIYGIEIKPLQSLQQIKEVWSSRTIETYTVLPFIENIEASLWRNIKTGKIDVWNSSMLSPSLKKNAPIVENYVLLDNLSKREYFRLSLEYLALKCNGLKLACAKGDETYKLHGLIKDIFEEITVEKTNNIKSPTSSIKYYPFLQDAIILIEQNPRINSEEARYIQSLAGRHRFWELNDQLQYGDWAANCLAIHEIEVSELFAYEYSSLREYVTKTETVDISYDEYLRRSKAGSVIKLLSASGKRLPSNKSQAIALADIPQTNMLKVWDEFLARPGRKSVKLLGQIHEEIIFGCATADKENLNVDIELFHSDIECLLNQKALTIAVKTLLETLLNQSVVSDLEFKLVQVIKAKSKQLKSQSQR
jgi:hypothetical protein